MADTPFFRGFNAVDYWFCVVLQRAADYRDEAAVRAICDRFEVQGLGFYTFQFNARPGVYLIVCRDYVFVVSQSTQNALQWVNNVLGSPAIEDTEGTGGAMPAYFYFVARDQYNAYIETLLAQIGTRKLVFVGFSLGAAAVQIERNLVKVRNGIDSACFAFGCPRNGDAGFNSRWVGENAYRLTLKNDPVPSVPPAIWSYGGFHSGWRRIGVPIEYIHTEPGWTIYADGTRAQINDLVPLEEVILGFDSGVFANFHSQRQYARFLRRSLPRVIPPDFYVFPQLDKMDENSFEFLDPSWPFYNPVPPALPVPPANVPQIGGLVMIQFVYFIRQVGSRKGYQEVYYLTGTDPQAAITAMTQTGVGSIINKRKAFLASDAEIYAARASVIQAPASGRLFRTKKLAPVIKGDVSATDTIMDDSIIYKCVATDLKSERRIWFRGIPRTYISGGTLLPGGEAALPLFQAFLQSFSNILQINRPQYVNTLPFVSVARSGTTGNAVLNIAPAAITLAAMYVCIIRGAKDFPLLNGNWVTPGTGGISATTVELKATAKFQVPTTTTGTIKFVSKTSFVGADIGVIEFDSVGRHDTGKGSFLPRGRRSPVVHHR